MIAGRAPRRCIKVAALPSRAAPQVKSRPTAACLPLPHRYAATTTGLRALTALVALRDKVINPLLAAAGYLKTGRKPKTWTPLDQRYENLRREMRDLFQELGLAA